MKGGDKGTGQAVHIGAQVEARTIPKRLVIGAIVREVHWSGWWMCYDKISGASLWVGAERFSGELPRCCRPV